MQGGVHVPARSAHHHGSLSPTMEGCDAVFGAQWLRTVGPIVLDFSKLQMRFHIEDKEVVLQGMSTPKSKIINAEEMSRELRKKKQGVLLQLYSLSMKDPHVNINPQLQPILTSYKDAFEEPKGLPPPRSQDHKIPLVLGSRPVGFRPYRYPHFQKT